MQKLPRNSILAFLFRRSGFLIPFGEGDPGREPDPRLLPRRSKDRVNYSQYRKGSSYHYVYCLLPWQEPELEPSLGLELEPKPGPKPGPEPEPELELELE